MKYMPNNPYENKFLYSMFCLTFALLFAFFLASLPVEQFVDRNNYLNYATHSVEIFSTRIDSGTISFLFNEPIWVLINLVISFFLTPENCIRTIVMFSTFITFYLILKNTPPKYIVFVVIFLFSPQILKNNIIHLRQGLAIAFFLLGWFSYSKNTRILFFIIAALVHSSFFIVIFGLALVFFLTNLKISNGIRTGLYLCVGIGVALFGLMIASYFGARQAERYIETSASTSGLGFLFWAGILSIYLMQGKDFIQKNSSAIFFIFLYLATYFSLPVTGRVLESVSLIILLASFELTGWRKVFFNYIYLIYFSLLWFSRIDKPWLGWGVSNY